MSAKYIMMHFSSLSFLGHHFGKTKKMCTSVRACLLGTISFEPFGVPCDIILWAFCFNSSSLNVWFPCQWCFIFYLILPEPEGLISTTFVIKAHIAEITWYSIIIALDVCQVYNFSIPYMSSVPLCIRQHVHCVSNSFSDCPVIAIAHSPKFSLSITLTWVLGTMCNEVINGGNLSLKHIGYNLTCCYSCL